MNYNEYIYLIDSEEQRLRNFLQNTQFTGSVEDQSLKESAETMLDSFENLREGIDLISEYL